jgi:hypothetical protein
MYLEQRLEIEDAERERKFLEEIGPVGRLVDNHWLYLLILFFVTFPVSAGIGFLIGMLL